MSRRFLQLVALGLSSMVVASCGGEADEANTARAQADAAFVADMIPHHQGAIDMAAIALERSEREEIRNLARSIVSAQKREIATMRQIARDLPEVKHKTGDPHEGTGHDERTGAQGMNRAEMGMDIDLDDLRTVKPFDRAFIDAMIPHHEGALVMARAVKRNGEEPRLAKIADDVLASQQREIDQMRAWRTAWYGG